jgi:hypothetical protein
MRRYALVLQLIVLICAAVASGYLWRAALGTGRTIRYVSAGKPYEPSWPTLGSARHVAVTHGPTSKAAERAAAARAARIRTAHAARSAAGKAPQLASATIRPRPTGSASAGAKGHDKTPPHSPTTTPPSRPAPTPSPAPALPPSPPSPAPATPAPATPAPSVSAATTKKPDRPGWGYGDRNHDHTGPHTKSAKSAKTPTPPETPEAASPSMPTKPPKGSDQPEGQGHQKK